MPPIAHIHSRFHDILFDMYTGDMTVEKSNLVRNKLPIYKNTETPIFDTILRNALRLSCDFVNVEKYFYEIIGENIYRNEMQLPGNIVLFGDNEACNYLLHWIRTTIGINNILNFEKPISFSEYQRFECIPEHFVPINRITHPQWNTPSHMDYESSGIFFKAMSGFSALIKRKKFEVPDACKKAKADFLRNADPIGNFVDEILVSAPGARVKMIDVYSAFIKYTGGDTRIGEYNLREELKDRGICTEFKKTDDYYYCFGMALKAP